VCHAPLNVAVARGTRRVALYQPCPNLDDPERHPAQAQRRRRPRTSAPRRRPRGPPASPESRRWSRSTVPARQASGLPWGESAKWEHVPCYM
jgi:hypothetical protein